jgi:hypothetical protein
MSQTSAPDTSADAAETAELFLQQNPICSQTLTMDDVIEYASFYPDGMVVLLADSAASEGDSVKLHDTLGTDRRDKVVVHEYDPSIETHIPDLERGTTWFFATGREAFDFFLSRLTP